MADVVGGRSMLTLKTPDPSRNSGAGAGYRAYLRAEGHRPIQLWGPDTRNPAFVEKLRQQCLALKNAPVEADILAFTEAAAGLIEGWE